MTDDETKPRRKAKDNPWYRLATLHGEPSDTHDEIAGKNRVTWNRWMAPRLTDDLKTKLLEAERCSAEELIPFPDDELRSIEAKIGLSISADLIDFSGTDFEAPFFAGFVFTAITFAGATFSGANFGSATFSGNANFVGSTFSYYVSFGTATFSGNANFGGATFSGVANFYGATFSSNANFDSGNVNFYRATFSGVASFAIATFSGDANFDSATFSAAANFYRATFSGNAIFVNAEMKGETDFERAKFGSPPLFFGAKLHEGTTWRYVSWPAPPEDKEQAGRFVEAYERLKLEMDKLKKHGDELDFFALEQQCRRVLDGRWKGLPIAGYGFVSDYGRSIIRPLLLLATTVLIGAFLFAAQLVGFWTPLLSDLPHARQAIGISFINTVSFLGKPLMKSDTVLADFPDWLKAVGTIQTILGIVLLFLFGLGVRNRFRLR